MSKSSLTQDCYSYIRFSSKAQEQGTSERRQWEMAVAYAKENNLNLIQSYKDLGVSGWQGANLKPDKALGAFLHAVQTGKVKKGSVLLVESVDRISRQDPLIAQQLISNIIRAGITIITLSDRMEYSEQGVKVNPSLLFVLLGQMLRANKESVEKSNRVKEARKIARLKGEPMAGKCPSWLKFIEGKPNRFERIVERCAIIKRIFDMAVAGIGKIAIARKFNEENIQAWGTGKRQNSGKMTGWHPSYIQKILKSRAVLGEFQPHTVSDGVRKPCGDVRSDYFPRIISDELYYRVLSQRTKNSKFSGRKSDCSRSLFSGMVTCGYCGSPLHYQNKGEQEYLTCYNRLRKRGCESSGWAYKDFEISFLTFISELNIAGVFNSQIDQKLAAAESALAQAEAEKVIMASNLATLKALLKGQPSPTVIESVNELDAELKDCNEKITKLTSAVVQERDAANTSNQKLFDEVISDGLLGSPDTRDKLRFEIRKRVKSITLFSNGINCEWDKRKRAFWVTLDSGLEKRVQPDFDDPCSYKSIRVQSPNRLRMPHHTFGQPATIFTNDAMSYFEFHAIPENNDLTDSSGDDTKVQQKNDLVAVG